MKPKWKVMLIAPVGTRDVALTDLSLLPDEALRQAWNHAEPAQRTGARQKGEVLLDNLDRYLPALRLDILGKAVRCVFDRYGQIDRLLLVATDQRSETAAERYRQNDTITLARVVREVLRRDEKLRRVGEGAKIQVIRGNPSNYEEMRAFYRQHLPAWTENLSAEGVCYLEVTGGTAQMGTMLLLEGVQLLRERAVPLYVMEEYDLPLTLDVGREMLADALKQTLDRDLSIYAYHAAWRSLIDEEALLRPSLACYDALQAVLDSARRRLNLDLQAAQAALLGADRGLPPQLQTRILRLATEVGPGGRTPQWLIAEVYHSAVVRRRTEAYASFVGRLFRFQEAMLRYLCETWGARFGGENHACLEPAWLDAQTGLRESLERAKLDPDRSVTRQVLALVARRLARTAGNQDGLEWLDRLGRFDQLANLRNRSVIAHGFAGISPGELADQYRGGVEAIEADMTSLLADVLGLDVSTNPYDVINDLCRDLMTGGG